MTFTFHDRYGKIATPDTRHKQVTSQQGVTSSAVKALFVVAGCRAPGLAAGSTATNIKGESMSLKKFELLFNV